jgi:hypothetical protein
LPEESRGREQSDYVEEACFYLVELEVPLEEIAKEFGMTADQVRNAARSYAGKISSHSVKYDEDAKDFWSRNFREGTGDVRVTLVDDRGSYYHGWRSELESMETDKLFAVLITNKKYADGHPLSEFSKGHPIIGYDPLIPLRRIRSSVEIIEQILEKRDSAPSSQKKSQ